MSTQLIKPEYLVILPPTQHHSFFRNLPPLFVYQNHLRKHLRGAVASGLVSSALPTELASQLEADHVVRRGEEQGGGGVNLPSPYFLNQFLPPSYFFEPISPSSLNCYVSFSPFSLLFPHISPSSQLFLGHFSLLPILFLSPL